MRDGDVICEVLNGGMLGEHQGINLPGTNVSIPSLTDKDRRDLEFGLKQAVDLVAISFVRTAEDVLRAKRAIARAPQRCAGWSRSWRSRRPSRISTRILEVARWQSW